MKIREVAKDLVQRSMTLRELPEDLVEEILCRVPATSLKKLRSTCKRWNRLVKHDRRFARKHSEKAAKQFLALRLTGDYRVCPIIANPHGIDSSVEVKSELIIVDPLYNCRFDISRVLHCDGLLLCNPIDHQHRVVVWNPLTGETKWIDAGGRYGFTFVLGYSQDGRSCSKSYKILSVDRDGKDSEIYELSSDSWRSLGFDITPAGSSGYGVYNTVSLKGNTYWFDRDDHKIRSLLKFDFSTEKCAALPLPYQCYGYENENLSVVREEKLSVSLQRDYRSKIEIWVTNKIDETTKVVLWTKVLALDLWGLGGLWQDIQITEFGSFLLDEKKKMVVWSEKWLDDDEDCKSKDMIYIFGDDNNVTQVDTGIDTWDLGYPAILTYVPSLVQINHPPLINSLAGTKRKRADGTSFYFPDLNLIPDGDIWRFWNQPPLVNRLAGTKRRKKVCLR